MTNDFLQIQELENRRKVVALLEMVGQTDQELVRMLDNQDRVEAGIVTLEGDFVPQRIRRYIEKIRASAPFANHVTHSVFQKLFLSFAERTGAPEFVEANGWLLQAPDDSFGDAADRAGKVPPGAAVAA